MCEFCTAHGEGKKWYLQIKNYTDEMLHEELSAAQKEIAKVSTRLEWKRRDFENFVMPAITGVAATPRDEPAGAPEVQPSEEQRVAEWKVSHFGQVLPIEDVDHVIDLVDSITRMPCGCRFLTTGKADKRYCFGTALDKWGELGKFPDAASSLEVLDKQEAKDILHGYDEEGLIHTIWTGVTPYVVGICNCDRDCGAYGGYIEESGPAHFFRGEYVCQVDWDLCTGCKTCMSQCQFGAQFYSSALEKGYIDPVRCFGCGVCRAVCPHEAIDLLPREEHPEVADLWLKPASA
jgi:ferredoxin